MICNCSCLCASTCFYYPLENLVNRFQLLDGNCVRLEVLRDEQKDAQSKQAQHGTSDKGSWAQTLQGEIHVNLNESTDIHMTLLSCLAAERISVSQGCNHCNRNIVRPKTFATAPEPVASPQKSCWEWLGLQTLADCYEVVMQQQVSTLASMPFGYHQKL